MGVELEADAIRSGETAQHVAHVAQQQFDAGSESGSESDSEPAALNMEKLEKLLNVEADNGGEDKSAWVPAISFSTRSQAGQGRTVEGNAKSPFLPLCHAIRDWDVSQHDSSGRYQHVENGRGADRCVST